MSAQRSRLFRSIVVFGATLGAGTTVVAATSTLISGCIDEHGSRRSWGIIDASLPPDVRPCGDAGCRDAWPTIADAPNDAATDAPHADGHT